MVGRAAVVREDRQVRDHAQPDGLGGAARLEQVLVDGPAAVLPFAAAEQRERAARSPRHCHWSLPVTALMMTHAPLAVCGYRPVTSGAMTVKRVGIVGSGIM